MVFISLFFFLFFLDPKAIDKNSLQCFTRHILHGINENSKLIGEEKGMSSSTVQTISNYNPNEFQGEDSEEDGLHRNVQFLLQISTLMAVGLLGVVITILSTLLWCNLRKIQSRKDSWDSNQSVLQSSPDYLPSYDKAVTESKNTWSVHGKKTKLCYKF